MEKIFKICCPCICVCLCVIVVSIIGISVYFLKQHSDWRQLVIGASLLILLIMCICVIYKCCNIKKIRLKSEDIESKLKNIEDGYKDISKQMSRCSFCSSAIANDSIYKTIEKVAETFCNKNCDGSKLNTFKEVVDAIIKSYESDRKTLSNSENSQEEENNGTDTNDESITRQ